MDFKYNVGEELVGLDTLEVVKTLQINFEKVHVKIIDILSSQDSYKLKVDSYSKDDFIFTLRRELLEDEEVFIPFAKYKKYKTYGDMIMLKTPNNRLREYTIEEILSDSIYDNYITLKLKAFD